jgi:hypothetical protein
MFAGSPINVIDTEDIRQKNAVELTSLQELS